MRDITLTIGLVKRPELATKVPEDLAENFRAFYQAAVIGSDLMAIHFNGAQVLFREESVEGKPFLRIERPTDLG